MFPAFCANGVDVVIVILLIGLVLLLAVVLFLVAFDGIGGLEGGRFGIGVVFDGAGGAE